MMQPEYNLTLVGLSFIIAWFGSYTGLNLAIRIPTANAGKELYTWLTKAAIAIGGGIWSMHFIGMLAYDMHMPIKYDVLLTILSLILAIVVCGIGLVIVGRGTSNIVKLLVAGVITGAGVATMHYIGMAAIEVAGEMNYNMPLFYTSLAIAFVAATAALWLAFNMRGAVQQFVSAVVMAIAVCGMHYTGMAAMEHVMPANHEMSTNGGNTLVFAFIIAAGSAIVFSGLLYLSGANAPQRTLQFDD